MDNNKEFELNPISEDHQTELGYHKLKITIEDTVTNKQIASYETRLAIFAAVEGESGQMAKGELLKIYYVGHPNQLEYLRDSINSYTSLYLKKIWAQTKKNIFQIRKVALA